MYAEIKSGHTFRKTNTDKLALDYLYFKKYSNCKTPYVQKNSEYNKGWLHYIKPNWIIAINIDTLKLYIIRDFQKVKGNIIEHINNYIKDISTTIWFHKNYHNNIHRFLEGGTLVECDIIITENENLDKKIPSSLQTEKEF